MILFLTPIHETNAEQEMAKSSYIILLRHLSLIPENGWKMKDASDSVKYVIEVFIIATNRRT